MSVPKKVKPGDMKPLSRNQASPTKRPTRTDSHPYFLKIHSSCIRPCAWLQEQLPGVHSTATAKHLALRRDFLSIAPPHSMPIALIFGRVDGIKTAKQQFLPNSRTGFVRVCAIVYVTGCRRW